ncbi:hypothetical protein E6C76_20870 [Pseudothauera nasutitermitis]|uniref:Uncharacterized protein n=1 Tax=Pseudothauera nasutitermitis TaxID=2565930 RepID=A0A4S4APD5_9RHOO|nr:hypothetical protein [Pseudothauera nasutitermitis]THF61531.1 hypothetical protein E6C76_20870 [Pseudothauera nasutitermitis]
MAIYRFPPSAARTPAAGDIDAEVGRALARTLHLLSQAAMDGVCRGRMRNLVGHLACLAEHPAAGDAVREACGALLTRWRAAQLEHFGEERREAVREH